jgi:hypothetical protein
MHWKDDDNVNNNFSKPDAHVYDQYCVPIANSYTTNHVINKWFEKNGIDYAGSCMPIEFTRF